jgi:hypothetical protein
MYTKAQDGMSKLPTEGVKFVRLTIDGVDWDIGTDYIAPVSIGNAVMLAIDNGWELPTARMVDEIWRQAEWKLHPQPRRHDGTPATMASEPVYASQKSWIEKQLIGLRTNHPGGGNGIIAGHYKDVVTNGKTVGLYGWHRPGGSVIQPFYDGHTLEWIDYSQGLRPCVRVTDKAPAEGTG